MDGLSTGTVRNRLVLLVVVASVMRAQTAGVPTVGAGLSASGDAAATAMQKSLEQQEVALNAFREGIESSSLKQQRESVVKQLEPLEGNGPAGQVNATATAVASRPGVTLLGVRPPEVSMPSSDSFFSVPWPGSLPLAMPKVQLATDSCEALASSEVDKLVRTAAGKHDLSPELLRSVMKQESAFKPCALSTAGAMGLMQVMPETADMLHLNDPFDPAGNVDAGAKFLKMMLDRFGGDVTLALAAYNAGPGAVDKAGGVPPITETLHYVSNILGDLPVAY